MEISQSRKRKQEISSESDESGSSVQTFLNLGDVNHTLSDCSSTDEDLKGKKAQAPKKRKVSHSKRNQANPQSDSDSSDCKIVDYIAPRQQLNPPDEINEEMESLCPNQLQDKAVAALYDQDLESDGDHDAKEH